MCVLDCNVTCCTLPSETTVSNTISDRDRVQPAVQMCRCCRDSYLGPEAKPYLSHLTPVDSVEGTCSSAVLEAQQILLRATRVNRFVRYKKAAKMFKLDETFIFASLGYTSIISRPTLLR